MTKKFLLSAATLLLLTASVGEAKIVRSYSTKVEFTRTHPCPATGLHHPHCPGYIIDHIVPLCAGGPDDPRNMQWQTVKAAHEKDLVEWHQCALIRRAKKHH